MLLTLQRAFPWVFCRAFLLNSHTYNYWEGIYIVLEGRSEVVLAGGARPDVGTPPVDGVRAWDNQWIVRTFSIIERPICLFFQHLLVSSHSVRHDAMATNDEEMLPTRQPSLDGEEAHSLLPNGTAVEDAAPPSPPSVNGSPVANGPSRKPTPLRQSSFAQPRPDGTPRTPNRVRFDVADSPINERNEQHPNGGLRPSWLDEEDFLMEENRLLRGRSPSDAQRLPLLTDIEAPSITVASEGSDFEAEDHLPSARPRSNLPNAFMNMANSIMSVGIHKQFQKIC